MHLIEGKPIFTDYIRLENRAQCLTTVPLLHPDSPQYAIFWSRETRKCIEGIWPKMFGQYRYMPGNLYYYGNYTLLQITEKNKVTKYERPNLDDLEWEFALMSLEAKGFSGFEGDEDHTSLHLVKDLLDEGLVEPTPYIYGNYPEVVRADGRLKDYITPRQAIRQLYDKPMGRPYYHNPTENIMVLGSRGGGKSYYVGLAEVEYHFIFDGAKHYDKEFIDQLLTVEICVGAAIKDKSAEMLSKVEASIDAKADVKQGRQFGVWEEEDSEGNRLITPCPFYRSHKGNLNCPNKSTPFRYKYDVEQSGNWLEKGTGSKILHVNYSSKKGDGAQAAAGGRYAVSVVEEVGLVENVKEIHISNTSVVAREGVRFGVEWYIGTSGNIQYIQASKELFLNPQDYNIVSIDNGHSKEGKDGKIGFFLPFYMTLRQFKDKDGNTDFSAVCRYINRLREDKKTSKNPKTIQGERMNRPCFINEMWVTGDTSLLPYDEASLRERELMEFERYKYTGTAVNLTWDTSATNGINYSIDHEAEPYWDYPINFEKRKDPRGCIMIYEFPQFLNGAIPNDMYCFVGHDPYVEESMEGGGSVGSTYILLNPKYIPLGFNGNTLVASYIDKPLNGLKEYYENQDKLLAFYGSPQQGLWYEKNRGQDCRAYYIGKNKVSLLALTPQHAQGTHIWQQNIQSYGYMVGNRIVKTQLALWMRDWLLEDTELKDGVKKNIFRIPDIYLIRQMMHYNLDDNFDAVDGFRGCIVGLRNNQVQVDAIASKKHDDRTLQRLLSNPKIFKQNANRFSKAKDSR